jgi:hypothetical protein
VCKKHRLSFLEPGSSTIGSVDFKHKGGRDGCLIGMYRGISHSFCEPLLRGLRRTILGVPLNKRRNLRMLARSALRRSKQIAEQTNIKQTRDAQRDLIINNECVVVECSRKKTDHGDCRVWSP